MATNKEKLDDYCSKLNETRIKKSKAYEFYYNFEEIQRYDQISKS